MIADIVAIVRIDPEKFAREAVGLTGLCITIIAALILPALV